MNEVKVEQDIFPEDVFGVDGEVELASPWEDLCCRCCANISIWLLQRQGS